MVGAGRGRQAAMARLYDRYAPPLLSAGQRMLGSRRDAEDLLHDVFVEVWQQAGDYSAARGSVKSWLFLRMRSRAIDRLRLASRKNVELGDQVLATATRDVVEDPALAPVFARRFGAPRGAALRSSGWPSSSRTSGLLRAQNRAQLGVPLGTSNAACPRCPISGRPPREVGCGRMTTISTGSARRARFARRRRALASAITSSLGRARRIPSRRKHLQPSHSRCRGDTFAPARACDES